MKRIADISTMGSIGRVTLAVLLSLLTCSTALAEVELSMRDGRVSIVARDATVRQILAEWAKIGGTQIVNLERISGGPVAIQLENVSEAQALAVLLRTVSGYIAARRSVPVPNASWFDRIIILPTSTAPPPPPRANANARQVFPPSAESHQQPEFSQPEQAAVGVNDGVDEQPSSIVVVGGPSPPAPAPLAQTSRQGLEVVDPRQVQFQMPQAGTALNPQTGAALPSGGALRPGMNVQPTPPSGVPGISDQRPSAVGNRR